MNNAKVTPQRACHRPIPTTHGLWPVKEATCGQLPIGSRDMRHTSNARFEPSRCDPRIVKPDWAIVAFYEPAWAEPPRRRESWGARRPVPIGGRWRFDVAGRERPATHARACIAGSVRCRSDPRLRARAPAQAGWRRRRGQAAGRQVTIGGVKTRRCVGASCSTCWGDRCRCRVAPTSSGFDYPGDKAKAWTRSRVVESGGKGFVHWDRLPPCHVRGAARAGWRASLPGGAHLVGG